MKQVLLAQAEAEKIREIGEAEAAVIEARGKAEAERMKSRLRPTRNTETQPRWPWCWDASAPGKAPTRGWDWLGKCQFSGPCQRHSDSDNARFNKYSAAWEELYNRLRVHP